MHPATLDLHFQNVHMHKHFQINSINWVIWKYQHIEIWYKEEDQ